jgi:hypothetical protein
MELRLEDDPMNCGKLRPCPKLWGTDDPAEVLVQGKRPSPAQRDQLTLPDDDDVVSYPRQALLDWAARQLAEQSG